LSLLLGTEMIASGSKSFTLLKKELPISTIFQLNHKLKFRVKMLYHPEQQQKKFGVIAVLSSKIWEMEF
jgi:hypothetical protein